MRVRSGIVLSALVTLSCAGSPPSLPPAAHSETALVAPSSSVTSQSPPTALAPPAPPSPPPPAYDLSNDTAVRARVARDVFGNGAQVAVVHDVFVFAGPGGRDTSEFRSALGVAEQALEAYFNGRFSIAPERAITVLLFPNATPYESYCTARYKESCISPFGFYMGSDRTMVMNVGPGIGTLTHELVHPLVEADFPDAPTWLNEGIASLYEQFWFPKRGQIAGGKNWRYPRLVHALSSKTERDLVTVPALFALSDEQFRGDEEALNYAMARYLCQWLDSNEKLWPFYHRYRDTHATDPTGARAFGETVGMTPDQATAPWLHWLRAL